MSDLAGIDLPVAPRVVETARPLSRSLIWALQRRFYEQAGVGAWGTGPVPYYITSTPFLARVYARLVLGFLRDCAAAGLLDVAKPVYLVELGAGSGRFSYQFRRRLDEVLRRSRFRDLRVTLVMSDFADATVAHWRRRPEFARWVADGKLDFARFDLERDEALTLIASGAVLAADQVGNPVVCIANYVFDSVPQDAFRVEGGRIQELLVELSIEHGPAAEQSDAATIRLEDLRISFHPRAIGPDHYGRADMDRLLEEYRQSLDGKSVLLPVAALDAVSRLRAIGGGRLFLLAGDKGYGQAADLPAELAPSLARHGSCSMMVNFDAIARYARAAGGAAWRPAARAVSLHVGAFLFGLAPEQAVECDLAYLEAVDGGGPDDFFAVQAAVDGHFDTWELDQLLAFLRLAGWDSYVFRRALPAIRGRLAAARPEQMAALGTAITEADAGFLPTGEAYDLAYDIGLLLLEMGQVAAAAEQFMKSLERHGPAAASLLNLAMCLLRSGELADAVERVEQALALDPGNEAGERLRDFLMIQLTAGSLRPF